MSLSATYVNPTTFTVPGDYSVILHVGRRIRAHCGVDGFRYGTVDTSVYSNPNTTIALDVVSSDLLTNNITLVDFGIVGRGHTQSVPEHFHDQEDGEGGVVSSSLDSKMPHGFVDRNESILTITDSTCSLDPVSTSFTVYVKGKKFVKTSIEVIDIPTTEGIHGIYYDEDGYLSTTPISIYNFIVNNAPVAIIYYDATNNICLLKADERHGMMDSLTHYHLHEIYHAQWETGLAVDPENATGNGNDNSHARVSVTDGHIHDEDIDISIANNTPQVLSPIAKIPVFYKTGTNGYWRKDVATDYPVKRLGTGRLAYNIFTGGSWGQAEVANGDFVLAHIFAVNDVDTPIIAIQGQVDYTTALNARNGANAEINSINTTGLPIAEYVPLASIIYQTSNTYSNAVKARVIVTDTGAEVVDWRFTSLSSIGNSSDHGNLAGLNDDDHPQYSLVSGTRAFTGTVSGVTPTTSTHLTTKGYVDFNVRQVSDTATASRNDIIIMSAVTNKIITLQTLINAVVWIKNTSGVTHDIDASVGNVDGGSSYSLTSGSSKMFFCDGSNWYVF